ncbi:hypothetical protein D3880_19215 [Pseudomonas cavernae]|uniref:Uncharacterized protein n=1 Tax=Pseudomonas cavernae TaxID=2320867 RepID=A0A385Z8K1_9PSED|nr:DUF465 domain-containing protein [Pseudomonas cavernae]AYC34363.1 hypothetical protein D3880_19215 [Pseudomonas cavernae]
MPFKLRTFDPVVPRKAIARQQERLSRLQQQFEAVDKHIFRVENGIESLENLSLAALKLHRSGLREDIDRLLSSSRGRLQNQAEEKSAGMMRAFV